jgi:NAD+ synthetase
VKIALAQINPTIADFPGNIARVLDATRRAEALGAELVLFSELALCGYPAADLMEKPSFLAGSLSALDELIIASRDFKAAILVGSITPAPEGSGKRVANSAILIANGERLFTQSKRLLPFYDVFDEQRYFAPAARQAIFSFHGEQLGITICEDAWNDKCFWPERLYHVDPVEELAKQGATILLNLSSSPFWQQKRELRQEMLAAIAVRHQLPVVMVNQVGGNDSLIFDGSSLALNRDGSVAAQARSFEEDLILFDTKSGTGEQRLLNLDAADATLDALVLGTRDYLHKCGFKKAVLGLSGGIDSALVAAIGARALGSENLLAIGMPSPYSSSGSIDDSRALAANLEIQFEVIRINKLFEEFNEALAPIFTGRKPDITEENIQSRIRGNLLMALSNKMGSLVLTTGNKSEMAVGYCTMYGDMAGALAVVGDVVKTRVYALCEALNRDREVIPQAILTKPPSAELRPDQKDTDSLPPYEILDPILEAYVERYETPEEISGSLKVGLPLVRRVVQLIERSEYKRQQAAPVLKVTSKAFGMGRRFPIAARVQV